MKRIFLNHGGADVILKSNEKTEYLTLVNVLDEYIELKDDSSDIDAVYIPYTSIFEIRENGEKRNWLGKKYYITLK